MSRNVKFLFPAAVLVFLSGCAVSTPDTVTIAPAIKTGDMESQPDAAAILPGTIALLPFANKTDSDFAFVVVRRVMFNHFASKNYRSMHWQDIDRRLELAGYDDLAKASEIPLEELTNLLGVDGVIYGNITHYNKTFAGIVSQVSVGVELKFVNREGTVIWEVKDVRRSRAGGISTNPVGLLMNVLVAAKHLHGDINLYRTADELGRAMAKEMPEPAALAQKTKATIFNVVHSAVGQILKFGDTLVIGLEGDPGLKAAARIDGIGLVDLEEAETGQYIGKLTIDKKHNVDGVAVTGVLVDEFGQMTDWVSPYGLLHVDNTPPGSVTGLKAESKDAGVSLSWRGPEDKDVASYRIGISASERGDPSRTLASLDPRIDIDEIANFTTVYATVSAVDKAGNVSAPMSIAALAAPDPRFAAAQDVDNVLPATISGIWRLTADRSPYYLRSDSRITTDGVLLVSPGVEIVVGAKARLAVLGELQMFGTEAWPIKVMDDDNQGFERFLVLQSNQPVRVQGVHIIGAGIPIDIKAGRPLISDCKLIDSRFNALAIGGSSRPTIRNCVISGAMTSGVVVSGQAQPMFTNNKFVNNQPFHLQNGSIYKIEAASNEWDPPASPVTILGDVSY